MTEKITVDITAEMRVRLCRRVEMNKTDYDEYLRLIDSELPNSIIDSKIEDIASEYQFTGSLDDWIDSDEPEEIEFELIES